MHYIAQFYPEFELGIKLMSGKFTRCLQLIVIVHGLSNSAEDNFILDDSQCKMERQESVYSKSAPPPSSSSKPVRDAHVLA